MPSERDLIIPGAVWRDDNSTELCENRLCRKRLSVIFGKHHCRWCGKIYCGDCAPRTALRHGKLLRQCNACRFPFIFRSFYNYRLKRRDANIAHVVLSFLDGRSINALLQSCYTALSEFHVPHYEYYDSIQHRFPSFFDGARIGKGGCGTVYKCEDRQCSDNPRVALKVITKSTVMTFPSWRKITTELDIMKEIDHKCVARLREVFQTPLCLVIVMEAGEGGTLKQAWEFVTKYKCNMEAFTANVVAQVAEGLDYLYRTKRVVHRDIKHDNIVLTSDYSRAMIIDFGLAEYIGNEKHQFFVPCGTMGFASPENIVAVVGQMTRFDASGETMHLADMFSLGVVAYMLLSGRKPLRGKRFTDLYADVRRGIRCEGPYWANVSSEAKSLVECLLKTNTNERATPAVVSSHPFIVHKAPLITEIAKRRKHELSLTEQSEGREWVYVDSINSEWDLTVEEDLAAFNRRKGLTARLSNLRFAR